MISPTLTVVVCTYNREDLLAQCLWSLVDQTLSPNEYEVLIVNNNSTDRTALIADEFCQQHHNFRLINEPKQGLSHARNRGWLEAMGEYVAYIDDDAKAKSDWCEKILLAFNTVTPSPVAVGGDIKAWYEVSPPDWFLESYESFSFGLNKGFLKEDRAGGFFGSNMTFPRRILLEYGGFSPDFGMVGNKIGLGEETHLFMRIYEKEPLFWYDPSILVEHWVPKWKFSVCYRLKRSFINGQSAAKLNDKLDQGESFGQGWINLCKFIIKAFIKVPWFSKNRKIFLVEQGQNVFYLLGLRVGQSCKFFKSKSS